MSGGPVLVVGAGGFIGSHLARRLIADGYDVHCLFHRNASRLPRAGVHHRAELGARDALHELMHSIRPRWVFNGAQISPYRVSQAGFLASGFASAIQGMVNLLDGCRAVGVECLVQLCSSTVYADVGKQPMDETTALAPASARGLCKLTERNLCLHYASAGALDVRLGRIFRAFGPDDSPRKLIQTALKAQLTGLPVALPARPSRRDYVYVDDVVEALLRMAGRPLQPGVEINIGSGVERRPDEILDQLELITGRHIRRQLGSYQPDKLDRMHWRASTARAEQLLDWRPTVSLEEGLRRTVDWFTAQTRSDRAAASERSGD